LALYNNSVWINYGNTKSAKAKEKAKELDQGIFQAFKFISGNLLTKYDNLSLVWFKLNQGYKHHMATQLRCLYLEQQAALEYISKICVKMKEVLVREATSKKGENLGIDGVLRLFWREYEEIDEELR
jgi:hypothetical protein